MLAAYWIYFLVLVVVDVAGVLLAAFTLPGTWLILAGSVVYGLVTRFHLFGWRTLALLAGLALVGEAVEFVLGGRGAKQAGGSKLAAVGGIIGALLGGIFLTTLIPIIFPFNTIVGILLGSFLGAFAVELVMGRPVLHSVRVGLGAAKGRLFGIIAKVTIAAAMLALGLYTAIPGRGVPVPAVLRPILNATMPTATGP